MSLCSDLNDVLTPYAQRIKGLAAADEQIKADLGDVESVTCVTNIVEVPYTNISKHYIGNNGEVAYLNDDRYNVSDYIPVAAGIKYILTASANYSNSIFAWYDAQKAVINSYNPGSSGGTVKEVTSEEFVAPTNAAFLVVAYITPKSSSVYADFGLVNALEDRVARLERDVPEKSDTIRVNISNNDIIITDIDSGNYLSASLNGSNNGAFNFNGYYASDNSLIKTASDDICPVYYDASYRCGNHGNLVVREATITNHGLTQTDIGKIFTSSTGIKYVLIKIVDANKLWFIHNSSSHTFVTGQMSTPLTDGTITLNIESNQLVQLYPSINNIKQSITIDGESISENGVYYGREVIISESYGSIDTLEAINALKNNVGNNTNASYYNDSLPCDLIYTVNYKTSKGLQTVVASKIVILRDGVNLTRFGVTQSQQIKDGRRILVPYTTDTGLITINAADNYTPEKWESNNFPPSKIYQFDTQSPIGFAIAYMTDYGNALPNSRTTDCTVTAINISGVYKVYPFVIYTDNNPLDSMTEIHAVAVRKLINLDNTISIVYEENGALYVEIEKITTDDADISVPKAYNGKIITVHHKSGNVYIPNMCVENSKLLVKGMGSLSIKIV